MKVKRFLAPDIRQAMQMVREQQGPDAVILSNRKVDGGVEIVSALDFDADLLSQTLLESSETSQTQDGESTTEDKPKVAEAKPEEAKEARVRGLGSIVDRFTGGAKDFVDPRHRQWYEASGPDVKPIDGKFGLPNENLEISGLHQEIQDIRRQLNNVMSENTNTRYSPQDPTHIGVLRHFSRYGFQKRLCLDLANQIGMDLDFAGAKQKAMEALAAKILISGDDLIDDQGIVALVGPTGVGKTTTLVKLASKNSIEIRFESIGFGFHRQLSPRCS